ncbi:hypothetical protein SAMN05216345_10841 [Cupriavidus sp. YR651]|uniref:hypothetical protein n=2 Tax=unclassified Cupriavidus TaxID=2640874 RepID=UPI000886A8F8|nr:hypothetical protein [Cupriavidus sp. YR651]SDD34714.1 hypothetical protein SAMN05216345_10841 [Cupriavidus sp. YR651]
MSVSRYLLSLLLLSPLMAWAQPNLVECQRMDQVQLRAASEETLLFLRCRARRISYEAPRLKGVSQKVRDDLVFACLDQADAAEHQLRVSHGYTRESLARKKCDE